MLADAQWPGGLTERLFACDVVDDFELAGDLSRLDRQVDFIIERWGEAIAAARRFDDAEVQIRAIGVDYVRRRFGARSEDS